MCCVFSVVPFTRSFFTYLHPFSITASYALGVVGFLELTAPALGFMRGVTLVAKTSSH